MISLPKCRKRECAYRRPSTRYKGKACCSSQYKIMLEGEFSDLYGQWLSYLQPEERLRSLMDELLEEVWRVEGGMLTKDGIRDRAYNFSKTRKSFTFDITLHQGAPEGVLFESRVVQSWCVDVTEGLVSLVSERDWMLDDVD